MTKTQERQAKKIYETIVEHKKPICITEISKITGYGRDTVARIMEMFLAHRIVYNNREGKAVNYRLIWGHCWENVLEELKKDAKVPIFPEELGRIRREFKVGDIVKYINPNTCDENHTYKVEVTRIKKLFKHIVLLNDGHSLTYTQLAQYARTGRRGCIK